MLCKLVDNNFLNLKVKINDQYFYPCFHGKSMCKYKICSFAFYSHLEIDPNKYQILKIRITNLPINVDSSNESPKLSNTCTYFLHVRDSTNLVAIN